MQVGHSAGWKHHSDTEDGYKLISSIEISLKSRMMTNIFLS